MPSSRPSASALTLAFLLAPSLAAAAGHDGHGHGPGPIHAHHAAKDDCAPCTRHAWREYGPAFDKARQLGRLDCAGLAAYAEGQRWHHNSHLLGYYLRPFPAVAPAPAPAPSIEPANAPPPPPAPSTPAAGSNPGPR